VCSTFLQSEAELLELLGRLGQLEFTMDAIRVSRDGSETAAAACA